MKKIYTLNTIILSIFLMLSSHVKAQLASGIPYRFEVASTPPAFPTTGAINTVLPAQSGDEWDSLYAPVGFSFQFAGKTYTKVVVSTNGWLALAPASMQYPGPFTPLPLNQLSNNISGYPIIAPLWDDLSASLITYNYTAGALWIRWVVKWDKANATSASSLFFVKLDGTDNSITLNYSNNTTYVANVPSASIGIAGVCPGDFYSVNTTSAQTAYIDSVNENQNIGLNTSTTWRPYNVSYKFTPWSPNDDCIAPTDLGTLNSCTPVHTSTYNATTSGSVFSCAPDVKDVWYSIQKPMGVTGVTVLTSPDSCESVTGTTVEIYENCSGSPIGCSTTGMYPNFGMTSVLRSDTVAETLYIRVSADADVPGKFMICAYNDTSFTSNKTITGELSPEIYSRGKTLIIERPDLNNDGAFEIYNLEGRKIKSGKIGERRNEISCEEFSEGIYLVNVTIGNRVV